MMMFLWNQAGQPKEIHTALAATETKNLHLKTKFPVVGYHFVDMNSFIHHLTKFLNAFGCYEVANGSISLSVISFDISWVLGSKTADIENFRSTKIYAGCLSRGLSFHRWLHFPSECFPLTDSLAMADLELNSQLVIRKKQSSKNCIFCQSR